MELGGRLSELCLDLGLLLLGLGLALRHQLVEGLDAHEVMPALARLGLELVATNPSEHELGLDALALRQPHRTVERLGVSHLWLHLPSSLSCLYYTRPRRTISPICRRKVFSNFVIVYAYNVGR